MRVNSDIFAFLMICTCLAFARSEDNGETEAGLSADPVGFINIAPGTYLPITSTDYEVYQEDGAPDGSSAMGVSEVDKDAILKTHNDLRALHGSPALVWSDTLATFGETWLEKCQFAHSHGPYGENLAEGYDDFSSAINAWYGEVKDYDFSHPGFSGKTGHFTQVVWKATTSVGCASKDCSDGKLIICNYEPAGNVIFNGGTSLFEENVRPKN